MNLKRFLVSAFAVASLLTAKAVQVDSTFTIEGSKGALAARLQLPDLKSGEKCPMVILCHGFGGNMGGPLFDTIASDLLKDGIGVVRFDFNGHGASEGSFQDMTVPNEIEDAKKVVAWTGKQPFTASVSLLGHSQGGVVASMTAGELGAGKIKAVVLMAPAAVLRDDALRGNTMGAMYDPWNVPEYVQLFGGLKLGRGYIETARDLPIYQVASRYTGPMLVIHGTADRVVPYSYGERYGIEMPDARVELIQGDDHGFSKSLVSSSALAAGWLSEHLNK
ncbi:MAG: alpha/beta fold hydrolase [Candidatus Homeothermus sp.]|nr:alpha/beta fold hydrolase [Candidatus Homeothermus sp.]